MIQIRPVSDLRNKFPDIEKAVGEGEPVYLTGGRLKPTTEALIGTSCHEFILKYQFSIGFFGTNAVSHENGFMTPDPEEAKIKECALSHTLSPYVLCDHAKFDMSSSVRFAEYDKACIITSGAIPKSCKKDNTLILI